MNGRGFVGVILGAFVVVALGAMLVTSISVSQLDNRLTSAEDFHLDALTAAFELDTNVHEAAEESFAYLLSGVEVEKQEALALFDEFDELVANFEVVDHHEDDDHHGTEGGVDALIMALVDRHDRFSALAADMFTEFEADGVVSDSNYRDFEEVLDEMSAILDDLIEEEKAEVVTAQAEAIRIEDQTADSLVRQGATIAALALLAGGIAVVLVRRMWVARNAVEDDLALYVEAIESTRVGVVIADARLPDHPLIRVNPSFERITGYSESDVLGRNCRFLHGPRTDPATNARIRERLAAGESVDELIENYTAEGTAFWNQLRISPVRNRRGELTHFVGLVDDVSDRVSLANRARRSEKMEAVGQLAGGIAHDFNNYLMVINAAVDELSDHPDEEVGFWAEQIGRAGEKSAALTRQLLAFSHSGTFARGLIDLNELVTSIEPLLRKSVTERVAIDLELRGPALVLGDRSQLEQVVTNIVLNARDAMQNGGQIRIETSIVTLSAADVAGYPDVSEGRFVRLSVGDTGPGVDPDHVDRIFEPFVTTKSDGGGTGLGLATVYGIAKQSGGFVSVESSPAGASFHVHLPEAPADSVPEPDSSHRDDSVTGVRRDGSVLLVEDDEIVRQSIRSMLEALGFDVVEAENGSVALGVLDDHPDTGLIVSDVMMPIMDGFELAERVHQRDDATAVLLMSGYQEAPAGATGTGVTVLHKPFTPQELADRIDEVLHESSRA